MALMIVYTLPAMQLVYSLVILQVPDLTRNNLDAKTQNAPVVNDSLILELDASTTSIPPVTASLPKIEAKTQNASVVNYLLILKLDACKTSIPPVTASLLKIGAKTLPDGYKSFPEIGAAFKLHNEETTFAAANRHCIAEGGSLAVIDSWTKYDIVHKLPPWNYVPFHVGITRKPGSKDWVDIRTGSPLPAIPWEVYEPDEEYDCVYIVNGYRGLCTSECEYRGYVCEIQIP